MNSYQIALAAPSIIVVALIFVGLNLIVDIVQPLFDKRISRA